MASQAQSRQLSPQLAAVRQQLDDSSARATQLVQSLTPEKLTQRPSNGGWSVGECIAHLTLSTRLYLESDSFDLTGVPAGDEPYKSSWQGRLLAWMLEPSFKMKMKTVAAATPIDVNPATVLQDFLATQEELATKLAECTGLAIDKKKIVSPFNKNISYNIYSLFLITCAHERRHLAQAEQVTKTL